VAYAWNSKRQRRMNDASGILRPITLGRQSMKKIDVDKDYKRSKFLIVAMVVQIVVVFVALAVYYSWLKS